jgi:hypothetical protein
MSKKKWYEDGGFSVIRLITREHRLKKVKETQKLMSVKV